MRDNQGCLGSSKDCFRLRNGEDKKRFSESCEKFGNID